MFALYSFSNNPDPKTLLPVESRALLGRDQWVSTEHDGAVVTGRILAVLHHPDGEALYDVELPLQTGHGKTMRVVRFRRDLRAIGYDLGMVGPEEPADIAGRH